MSTLASILHFGQDESCLTTDFAKAVHNSSDSIRASPVFAMESFQLTDPTTQLFAITSGKLVHQFIMITVHLANGQPGQLTWTYLRIDFAKDGLSGHQLVTLSDDHEGLRGQSHRLGRVAAVDQPRENGPSLDDIALLLEAVHCRTLGGYNCFGRNCFWLTENLLMSTARKYPQHWLAGHITPQALRTYTEHKSDAVACVTGMSYQGFAAQTFMGIAIRALRGAAVAVTQADPNRIESHDEDVRLILQEWTPCVKAWLP